LLATKLTESFPALACRVKMASFASPTFMPMPFATRRAISARPDVNARLSARTVARSVRCGASCIALMASSALKSTVRDIMGMARR
jgi:hypothetical protein